LLSDPDVKRWFDNVARGSRVTADVYLGRLGILCEKMKVTPKGLLALSDKELDDRAMDLVSEMEKEDYAGSYTETIVKALRSWLAFNRRELKADIRIKGTSDTPSLAEERVPTQAELKKIFLAGSTQARVACSFVSQAGVRLEVLGNYLGDDGLRFKDLPEMAIKDGKVEFAKIPTTVTVRKNLSKARHQYFTFLSEEGCEYLKDYLEERIRKGETLTKDSSILCPKIPTKQFIRTINVGDLMRKAMRTAGFKWRPYVLRSYFDTEVMLAESKGKILRDYRQFFMGHRGDIEHRYTLNKGNLPPEILENMREAYVRSQEFLQTKKSETISQEDLEGAMKKQLFTAFGYTEKEVEGMDLSKMSGKELQQLMKEKILAAATNGRKQKVIPMAELKTFIEQGCEYVTTLPSGEVIIKLPG
jgi:hypothetical protein